MDKIKESLVVSIFTNIFIISIEIISGIVGGSVSLITSGIHGTSDLLTDIFSLVGAHFSSKPKDDKHPFGYGKFDNIFSMLMGVFILLIGIFMLKGVFSGTQNIPSLWLVIIIFISMTARYFCSNFLMRRGIKYNSDLLISNAKEGKIDVISSFFLLFVIILSQFSDKISWLAYLDLVGGVLISVIVIYVGLNIIHDETKELVMIEEEDKRLYKKISGFILRNENIGKIKIKSFIKFGGTYLIILEIYFNKNISVKDADIERNKLEEELCEKYKAINTIILKIRYEESDKDARVTRGRNSKKKTS